MKIVKIPIGGFGANCWLLVDDKTNEAVIIDPSPAVDTICGVTEKRHAKLKYILLTHGHFDHMLSLGELRAATGVPAAIHTDDAECLTDGNKNAYTTFFKKEKIYKPCDILFNDGDSFTFGDTMLTVIHTPGHTKGSCCFICGDSIFSGDTLFDGSVGRCDMYGGSDASMEKSIRRLCTLEGDYKVYPGHGSITSLERQRQFNPYIQTMRKE